MAQQQKQNQHNIPVQMSDALVFDHAFSSMKERFAAHMKDIDEEMTKISKGLEGHLSRSTSGTTTSKGPLNLDFLNNSPLVEGEGENRRLRLQYDLSQFNASEITVTIEDNVLIVLAVHEEASDDNTTVREYRREFHFPQGVDPKTVVSSLSKDGVLVIEAPIPTTIGKQLTK